jgi:hypothetical protein
METELKRIFPAFFPAFMIDNSRKNFFINKRDKSARTVRVDNRFEIFSAVRFPDVIKIET